MGINRREFLRIAGLSTLMGLGGKAVWELVLPGQALAQYTPKPGALVAKRWAMVVDMRKMTEQLAAKCIKACHSLHNVPQMTSPPVDPEVSISDDQKNRWQMKWLWTDTFEHAFPGQEQQHMQVRLHKLPFLLLCNHCDNPPCVRVCPTQATFRRPDGIVMMDMHRCIGCRYCMAGCPYGARSFNWRDPRPFIAKPNETYPTREKGVVEKCFLCVERLEQGQLPACVEVSQGTIVVGDIADPKSKVRELLRTQYTIRRKPQLGTNPHVFYII